MEKVKRKLNLRGVLDGLRSTVSSPKGAVMGGIEETLRSEHFQVAKTVRHGFPYKPTAMAYDPVQNLLAIGTKTGSLRLFGQPGVDCQIEHEGGVGIVQILFLVNQGGLVTVCDDDSIHLWDIRKKHPAIAHTLKFQRERITYAHHPFDSKWVYVGTEKGNVHVIKTEGFDLSGYKIHWNKVIELTRKTHPGPVIHLSDNPSDPNKLLIGFESGAISMWDLKLREVELRCNCAESLRSVAWHHEGKQIMCSHMDGSLTIWNLTVKPPLKPQNIIMPHAKIGKDGKPEPCRTISKVEWKTVRNGEPYIIFSGGMAYDRAGRSPCLTVIHGKNTTVLEMEHDVVDFFTLCATPWKNDFQDPYGIVVLLQNDLVVVDLTSPGYPCFENPYPMDIHESPVTSCVYMANCVPDLIRAFYCVGSKQKKSGYSDKEWPIKGGECGVTNFSYHELIITGHADGSLKFWDASATTLEILYKLKTAKLFDKSRLCEADEDPYAIQHVYLCAESRLLVVAGFTHVILFKYSKQEATLDCPTLDVSLVYEIYDELDSPGVEYPPAPPKSMPHQASSIGSYSSVSSDKEKQTCVTTKASTRKWSAGYQPELCILLNFIDTEAPPPITSLSVNSSFGLLAFGNECGISIIDIIQKTCLLTMGTPDLYGSNDPYSRAPRSPKNKSRPTGLDGLPTAGGPDDNQSPTHEQGPSESRLSPLKSPKTLATIEEQHFFHQTVNVNVQESQGRHRGKGSLKGRSKNKVETDRTQGKESVLLTKSAESSNDSNIDQNPAECSETAAKRADVQSSEPSGRGSPDGSEGEKSSPSGGHADEGVTAGDQPGTAAAQEPAGSSENTPEDTEDKVRRKPSLFRRFISKKDDAKPTQKPPDSQDPNETHHNNNKPDPGDRKYKSNPDLTTGERAGEAPKVSRMMSVPGTHIGGTGSTQAQPAPVQTTNSQPSSIQGPARLRSFVKKVSKSLRTSVGLREDEDWYAAALKAPKFDLVDLTAEDVPDKPPTRKMTYRQHLSYDKTDGSFSRSRSSSMSSLDNISKEAIQCLVFADAFTRKTDSYTCPCLWVGTVLGSVLIISISLPDESDRKTQPVIVSPSGTIFRLKGAILAMSFLDCNGILIPTVAEQWKDESPKDGKRGYHSTRQQSMSSLKARMSPTSSQEMSMNADRQLAILCSERHARVIALPSQTVAFKAKITDTSVVAKADIINIRDSVCLGCYIANGHVIILSLPSLKPLLDVDFLPLPDVRIAKTFCFSNNGHALYFCSPMEVQKITFSADICENLSEMLPDLFKATETPEGPKQNFFKNLFTGGPATLDREELFGESCGKATKGVAIYTPGTGQVTERAGAAMSEIGRAKMAALERGQHLGELDERTERMKNEAESYGQNAHQLMLKYKDKKWYQF